MRCHITQFGLSTCSRLGKIEPGMRPHTRRRVLRATRLIHRSQVFKYIV